MDRVEAGKHKYRFQYAAAFYGNLRVLVRKKAVGAYCTIDRHGSSDYPQVTSREGPKGCCAVHIARACAAFAARQWSNDRSPGSDRTRLPFLPHPSSKTSDGRVPRMQASKAPISALGNRTLIGRTACWGLPRQACRRRHRSVKCIARHLSLRRVACAADIRLSGTTILVAQCSQSG